VSVSLFEERVGRARAIREAGGLEEALVSGALPHFLDLSLSEALVLGLLRQGVRTYVGVFGHGTTDVGEALRAYAEESVVRVHNVRSEIEASHAAAALRRGYGETAAVFTSIGPGALQALSASLVGLSDGIGLYYLFGDETTQDEGYNMQQIPRREQALFLKLASAMGPAYSLHTGEALPEALRRGASAVFDPEGARPFYLLLPMNTQGKILRGFNVDELPRVQRMGPRAPSDPAVYEEAVELIKKAERVVVKTGNGALGLAQSGPASGLLSELLERADAAYVHGPQAVGILGGGHPRNMTVGGSKGSIAGNAAMAEADLVIAIGARAVCQWDSSGTAWKKAEKIIAINTRAEDATHYNRTLPLVGDAVVVVRGLVEALRAAGVNKGAVETAWSRACREKRGEWDEFVRSRLALGRLYDSKFRGEVLTAPAAIAETIAFCGRVGALKHFDAGDVQAIGFQLVEDGAPGDTFTETGASYMGFAASAVLASGLAVAPRYPVAFSGDGSFMMSPQILVDAVHLGVHGMIVIFDNRRMAAISGLQLAQYGAEFRTDDNVAVDYAALADAVEGARGFRGGSSVAELRSALEEAFRFPGLAVVHVQVYSGEDERGGLGAWGSWNVGSWCEAVQAEKHRIGL
jgi:3D-(3,5/4)-trihydroxycyclohexane-1,2-dione acylhydrolase (decyclizing)